MITSLVLYGIEIRDAWASDHRKLFLPAILRSLDLVFKTKKIFLVKACECACCWDFFGVAALAPLIFCSRGPEGAVGVFLHQ